MTPAPVLVIAVGNPSRGDDALGPALLDRLRGQAVDRDGAVELLGDFQLQVEHALDLQGRRAVLFVDAAWPSAACGATLTPIAADTGRLPPASHALRPQALLCVAETLNDGGAPPAWQLAIEGCVFALGEPLSATAERHLQQAMRLALDWLGAQREAAGAAAATDA